MSGKAPVKEYFTSQIKSEGKAANSKWLGDNLAVSFHGRALKGKKVTLPSKWQGCICKLEREEGSDTVELTGSQQFQELTYWNHDDVPSTNDRPAMLMQYLNFLDIIHGPESALTPSPPAPAPAATPCKPSL